MKTEIQTKKLEVGLGIYPNSLGTYVATIEDPNPISNEIVAHVFGETRKEAEEKASGFAKAANMHDALAKLLGKFLRYETDKEWMRKKEIRAAEASDGNVSYMDTMIHEAEQLLKQIDHK